MKKYYFLLFFAALICGSTAIYAHTVYLVYPNRIDTIPNKSGAYTPPALPSDASVLGPGCVETGYAKKWYINGKGDGVTSINVTADITLVSLNSITVLRPLTASITYGQTLTPDNLLGQIDYYVLPTAAPKFDIPTTLPSRADSGVTIYNAVFMPEDTLCVAPYNTPTTIGVNRAPLIVKARPVILRRDANHTLTTSTPNLQGRYDVIGMVNCESKEVALGSTMSTIQVNLRNNNSYYQGKGDKYAGCLENEVIVSGSGLSNNYKISYQSAPVYISYISFDIAGAVVYGEAVNLNATHALATYNNELTYLSSNPNVITVNKNATTQQWEAKIKKVGEASISVCFKGGGEFPADTIALPITVVPYCGLRIEALNDTILYGRPIPSNPKDFNIRITGLQNGDIPEDLYDPAKVNKPLRVRTTATSESPLGMYKFWSYNLVSSNYANIRFDSAVLSILLMGNTKQTNIAFSDIPASVPADTGRIVVVADIFATSGSQSGKRRKITYSSDNDPVAEVIKDTSWADGSQPRRGAVVLVKSTGVARITAYQPGDPEYHDTSITRPLTVVRAQQKITFPDFVLPATEWTRLAATSSSGLKVTYSSSNVAIATIGGDTAYAKGNDGNNWNLGQVVTITATQAGDTNYIAAPPVALPCTLSIPEPGFTKMTLNFSGLLAPSFSKTTYNYTLAMPCDSVKIDVDYKVKSTLSVNDKAVSNKKFVVSKYPNYDTLRLVVTNEFEKSQIYTIAVKKTLLQVVRFWNDVYAVDIKRLTDNGYEVERFQWYNSTSATGQKKPIADATDAYLDTKKLTPVAGYYTVKFYSAAGDSIEGCPYRLESPVTNALLAYPNPVQNAITVVNPQWQDGHHIDLLDLSGAICRRYAPVAPEQTIDITGFKQGMYILRIGKRTARILIQGKF